MKTYAAVLAAGSGTRFGADKAMLPLRGKPLWKWSFDTLAGHPGISGVGLVCRSESIEGALPLVPEALFVTAGGATRSDSSRIALETLPADAEAVLIHDAARPLLDVGTIDRVLEGVARSGAAAPALEATDTVKQIGKNGSAATLDRTTIRLMQTPQGARVDWLREAFSMPEAASATDDMAMLEAAGRNPAFVEGSARNLKVTTPDDWAALSGWLGYPEIRTGFGYDIHPFSHDPGRELWLGGVRIGGHPGLDGHSDADALLHAVTDALLGAAGLGDIGGHFPNSDPQWRGASSAQFVSHAAALLASGGWQIRNIDATVIAEAPRIAPHAEAMRRAIAEAAGIDFGRIGLKATTHEQLGAIGRGEGIAAYAVATIAQYP